ncbi:3-hydroxyacyl-CoA dehydrogenase/enoyl-CoA hydratase family protein [Sedimenticola hydrogenitrophicus]|uniref:3-hydroxyacyl-CoA dehydrogenase/enoyl-CoA hydratase family protein n=1 Tax=Sedimenticola hydrogenitrophicus TaxID=2967975 RepID=UPI0021A4BC59|nr:3-hydroxyacyl-CoA dehydrogenase/enoyl-CoA hydratase family protein [Sedimenticola hydrogenitrophicus]
MDINKVAVIGAGVMGAGIAAHITNAGIPVVLLDIVPKGADNRNAIAEGAVQRLLKAQPAPFMHKRNARLVTTGNTEDHLELLAECDWIIEAVIERLDIKQELYRKIDAVRKPGSVVSSNTSTIPLRDLVDGQSENFAADFLITHFFNPPRYMRLLEITSGEQTRADAVSGIPDFCDRALGKGVVACKDTPGFIANRIGIFWIQVAILEAMALGLTVEEADAVMGRPLGIPKTGVFGLSDLVGIDLMPHLMESMRRTLPAGDSFLDKSTIPELVTRMIADGYTGRKGKGGFYRINRSAGGKIKESIDLSSGEYHPSRKAHLESLEASRQGGLKALVAHPDKGGQYARRVLAQVLGYAASLIPEIADDVLAVDAAMKLGYAWKYGPFELIDRLGTAHFSQLLEGEGVAVPPLMELVADQSFYRTQDGQLQYLDTSGVYQAVQRPEGVLLLSDIKRRSEPLAKNGSAALWDIGDGVVCLEYTSKMNAMDPEILALMREAISIVSKGYKALVLHNEGDNYSVGANLGLLLFAANLGTWDQIEEMIEGGQETYKALKYAPFPVVGAPSGMALGGGCESLLHCDAVQAHAETYIGLVEVGVGLVPAWGGSKEMLQRWITNKRRPGGPMPAVIKCFETISTATVAKSAAEAKDYLFLRPDDGITMNRDRLLADAKARALAMAEEYRPPEPIEIRLPGSTAKAAMEMAVKGVRLAGRATAHDVVVSMTLAELLSGGDTDITETLSEDDLLRLERGAFMTLVRHPDTLDRMEHMLETGKSLRN